VAVALGAAAREPAALRCAVRTMARIDARSNLHPFEGHTDTLEFTVRGTPEGGDTLLEASFAVPVRSLSTGNDSRDRDMYKMFEADTYPDITVKVPPVALSRLRPDGSPSSGESGTVPFEMTIRTTTRTIRGRVERWRESGERCTFTTRFAVSLKRFGLEPPRPFFGALYVEDTVRVAAPVWIRTPGP
jgi:polyisoprenoid-binding protein YceI